MPALNFNKEFAPKIISGEKRQTIRALRKDGRDPKAGQTLYLYTGMRTKSCKRIDLDFEYERIEEYCLAPIMGAIRCKSVEHILIPDKHTIVVNGEELCHDSMVLLSTADGFDSWRTGLIRFFEKTHGLPFEGKLIKW